MSNDLAEFLVFEVDGKSWNSTRAYISDLGAAREAIRMERRQCASGTTPAVQGVLMAQPISESEMWEYIWGAVGSALVLHLCVSRANQTFTQAMADEMVMTDHEFVHRLYVESRLLNPPGLPDSSSASSGPE